MSLSLSTTISCKKKGAEMKTLKISAKPTPVDKTKTFKRVFNEKAKELGYETNNLTTSQKANVQAAMKRDRERLIKEVLKKKKDVHSNFDLSTLSKPYQRIAKTLLKAVPYVKHVYGLQIHPDYDELEVEIRKNGSKNAIKLFERNRSPRCGNFAGEEFIGKDHYKCALTESYPENMSAAAMWPEGMNQEIYDEIKANAAKSGDPSIDPFLSPFTSIYWKDKENGILAWRTFYNDPFFHEDTENITKIMEQAANEGEEENKKAGKDVIDPSLIKQLRVQAAALKSSDPYPYKESDRVWMQTQGPLRLCLGPYEVYNDHHFETKAFWQYILAVVDEKKSEEVQKIANSKNEVEKVIAKSVGEKYYKARDLSKHETATPFLYIIVSEGDLVGDGGAITLAHNLPNLYREDIGFIIEGFSNHFAAKKKILEDIAKVVVVPEQQDLVDFSSFIDASNYHEVTHATGPQGGMKAVGKDVTIDVALANTSSDLEETKADTGILLTSDILYGKDSPKFKNDAVTALAGLFRSSRFGLESHGKGGLIRLAYFVNNGAVEIVDGRFKINFDKAYDASVKLIGEIGTIQATGDKKGAEEFIALYMPKGMEILETVRGKIESAGIPIDVDIHYHVKQ